jgi:hypothetical protein
MGYGPAPGLAVGTFAWEGIRMSPSRLVMYWGRCGPGPRGVPGEDDMEVTRRRFLGRTLGATAVGLGWGGGLPPLLGAGTALAVPTLALADDGGSQVEPRPIPNGDAGTHHFLPGRGKEVTTITDFNGVVGVGQLTGTGTATGFARKLNFSVDNRFLVGEFIGVDGQHHRGAFGVF